MFKPYQICFTLRKEKSGHVYNKPWLFVGGLTNDGVLFADLHLSGSHVSDLNLTVRSIDKDIVAFDVAVDDWGVIRVKIDESLENLSTPSFHNLDVGRLQFADVPINAPKKKKTV